MLLPRIPLLLAISALSLLLLSEAKTLRSSAKSKDPGHVFSSFSEATTKFQLRKSKGTGARSSEASPETTSTTATTTSATTRRRKLNPNREREEKEKDDDDDDKDDDEDDDQDDDEDGDGGGDDDKKGNNGDKKGRNVDKEGLNVDTFTSSSTNSVFVKMHWESHYYWQESDRETKWCVRCYKGDCVDGKPAVINDCDDDDPTPLTFESFADSAFRIRVTDKDLCLEMNDDSDRYAIFKQCSDSSLQLWVAQNGNPFKNEPFEIVPQPLPGGCLTQTHDPKDGELLWVAPSCEYARDDYTSLFVFYYR